MTIDKVMMIAESREILLMKKNERGLPLGSGSGCLSSARQEEESLLTLPWQCAPSRRHLVTVRSLFVPKPCLRVPVSHTDIFGFGAVHKEGVVRR